MVKNLTEVQGGLSCYYIIMLSVWDTWHTGSVAQNVPLPHSPLEVIMWPLMVPSHCSLFPINWWSSDWTLTHGPWSSKADRIQSSGTCMEEEHLKPSTRWRKSTDFLRNSGGIYMKFRMYLVTKHNNIRYHKVHFAVSLEAFCVTFSDSERDKLSGEVRTSVGSFRPSRWIWSSCAERRPSLNQTDKVSLKSNTTRRCNETWEEDRVTDLSCGSIWIESLMKYIIGHKKTVRTCRWSRCCCWRSRVDWRPNTRRL